MASQKRIAKELNDCTTSPPAGMTIALANDSDIHKWHVTLVAPADSVYAGGTYGLVVTLPADYPFRAPTVAFSTRIYHPNVTNDSLGGICLGALKPENWKPASRLLGVLEAVRSLLVEPNPDDPVETRIADEFRADRAEFEKNAKAYVARYAKGPPKFELGTGPTAGGAAAVNNTGS